MSDERMEALNLKPAEGDGLFRPKGDWLVTIGDLDYDDGKAPTQKFGGWPSGEPSSKNADWDHDGTVELGHANVKDAVDELDEKGLTAFLLDIDGANLLVLDYDYEPEPEEADIDEGKWPDRDELREHIESTFGGQTVWESQSGGFQVPVLLTDEAFEQVYDNQWRPGPGVDSLKGPAAKGYTAAPLSPGYSVYRRGGMPLWGVEDLEEFDGLERSETGSGARSMDPGDFDPIMSRDEAYSVKETDDIGVLLTAINQLRPGEFDVPYPVHGDRGDGVVLLDPGVYRATSGGESLGYLPDQGVFWDYKLGKGMFADKLVALAMGLIDSPHETLDGSEWWRAVEALRSLGAPIPEWTGPEPEWVADLDFTDEMTGSGDEALLWELRRDYQAQMEAAVGDGRSGHLVGPKGVGKTYNAVQVAGWVDEPREGGGPYKQQTLDGSEEGETTNDDGTDGERVKVTVFAPTKEKYREIIAEAEDQGVSVLRLPSFPEHSPLWDEWESEYLRGAFPREIYNWDDRDTGEDEYKSRQDEDFDDYDLLVGAPQHAFVESVTEGRVVFFDDASLNAYRDVLDRGTKDQINTVLEEIDVEWNSWKDVRSGDWNTIERALARHISGSAPTSDDVWEALQDATEEDDELDRRAFLSQMPGVSLDVVDWMRALTGHLHSSDAYEDRGMRLVTADESFLLVRAPDLSGAEQVFTMGAVPATEQLEAAFDDMSVTFDGMFGSARHGDMERAINRYVIQTSDAVHNKSSDYASPERIEAIREGVAALGDELGIDDDVHVFSTKHEADEIEGAENYGSLIGTNKHAEEHLAVVGASQHFGDEYVKIEAAYAGASPTDPVEAGPFQPRRWDEPTHAATERRMRRSGAYEAITRMGRNDTDLTIVTADTAELPPWLQVVDQSDRVGHLSPSARELYEHIEDSDGPVFIKDGEGGGAAEELDYSKVQLYSAREELLDAGFIEKVTEGKYGAEGFEGTESEPVNSGIIGLNRAELTGSSFSGARNPDWDVFRYDMPSEDQRSGVQMTLAALNQAT